MAAVAGQEPGHVVQEELPGKRREGLESEEESEAAG